MRVRGKRKRMVFVINNLKYDTDKMELVSEKCEYNYLTVICGDVCMFNGKNVKLFRSDKGNWLLTYEGDWHKSFAITLDEEKAKDILLTHDLKAYEKMFGELEEA